MSNAVWVPDCIQKGVAFKAIQAYAAFSYAYYQKDISLVSDKDFDFLCRWLEYNFEWVKPHDLNNYLDLDALIAGTGYQVNVVGQTRDYAELLIADYNKAMDDLV